jgi:hypothetical protein
MAMSAVEQTLTHPVSMYLPEPQTFRAVLGLPEELRKAWLHATLVEIKNLIDKETFSLDDCPQPNEQVLPTKLVYKAKQTSKGNLDKLKSRVVAHGDLEKGPYKMDTWAKCATARGIKILLAFAAKHNKRVKSGDFVGAYLQAKQVGRVFVSLDKSFVEYFPKYKNYFGRPRTTDQERDLRAHD